MWEKLQTLDRRVIYLFFVIALMIPLFKPMGLPIPIGEESQRFYDAFDKLAPGSVVLMSADYSPGSSAECNPQFEAVIKHAFRNNYKVMVFALWEQGAMLARDIAEQVSKSMNKTHGVDWIFLGYRPGGNIKIREMSNDLWGALLNIDGYDRPLNESPMMANIKKLYPPDIDAIVCFSSGSPGDGDYMAVVTDPSGIPLFTGQVAVQVPARVPLIRSGQLAGMIPGMGGAAEYENLTGFPGKAAGLMDAQSLAHIVILGFIVLGNIAFLAARKT